MDEIATVFQLLTTEKLREERNESCLTVKGLLTKCAMYITCGRNLYESNLEYERNLEYECMNVI